MDAKRSGRGRKRVGRKNERGQKNTVYMWATAYCTPTECRLSYSPRLFTGRNDSNVSMVSDRGVKQESIKRKQTVFCAWKQRKGPYRGKDLTQKENSEERRARPKIAETGLICSQKKSSLHNPDELSALWYRREFCTTPGYTFRVDNFDML